MTDEPDHEFQLDSLHARRGSTRATTGIILLAAVFALVYLWLNYGDQVRSIVSASVAAPVVASGEESAMRADFEAFRQRTAESLRSAVEAVDQQKADIERLSDQLAALSAKVNALQTAASSVPIQTSIASPQPVASPRSAANAQRKKPAAPKTVGPVSVGGAPLPSYRDIR